MASALGALLVIVRELEDDGLGLAAVGLLESDWPFRVEVESVLRRDRRSTNPAVQDEATLQREVVGVRTVVARSGLRLERVCLFVLPATGAREPRQGLGRGAEGEAGACVASRGVRMV